VQKHLITGLLAAALLGIAVTAAAARNLELTNSERGFRIAWSDLRLEARPGGKAKPPGSG